MKKFNEFEKKIIYTLAGLIILGQPPLPAIEFH